jgi:uncharacterized damage-inducible protein DinB
MSAAGRAYCPLCGQDREVVGDPLRAQAGTPGRIRALVRGVRGADLVRRPAPGRWSIKEIVCHLADTEIANAWRYRKILAEENLPLTTWNQDAWANETAYRRQDLGLALTQFDVLRRRNLETVRLLPRSARGRIGVHPEHGPITVEQILQHLVHHDRSHLGQIERLRAGLRRRRRQSATRNPQPAVG